MSDFVSSRPGEKKKKKVYNILNPITNPQYALNTFVSTPTSQKNSLPPVSWPLSVNNIGLHTYITHCLGFLGQFLVYIPFFYEDVNVQLNIIKFL